MERNDRITGGWQIFREGVVGTVAPESHPEPPTDEVPASRYRIVAIKILAANLRVTPGPAIDSDARRWTARLCSCPLSVRPSTHGLIEWKKQNSRS
jgi:hypothetical protein